MSDNRQFIPPLKTDTMGRAHIYENITQTIGHTPLVRLSKLINAEDLKSEILLKCEFFNPLSSVKDRIGLAMIAALEDAGKINSNTILVEPTSGNTGIALAFVAAERGYKIQLVMPESMSLERRQMIDLLGAELVLTPAEKGMKGALDKAEEILANNKNAISPSQFTNEANPAVHAQSTAMEIWNDTNGNVDAIVAGVGTGGTLMGCAKSLKPLKKDLVCIAVEPDTSPVLSKGEAGPHKIQGIGAGFIPEIVDTKLIDQVITVENDEAFETSRLLARLEGIAGGISTGANVAAAIKLAKSGDYNGKTIVTFAPSSADRYLSTALFDGLG